MNVVDSSGWLAYFADEPEASHFAEPLADPSTLLVPAISIYEVFKVVRRETDESKALQAIAAMQSGKIINLTPQIAMSAARLSLAHNLPMADSIILATARKYDAMLWTLDSDFKNMEKVKYYPKATK